MICSHRSLRHRIRLAAPALPVCLLLSSCGGGGGSFGVASTPPPPPPPAQNATVDVKTSWLDSPATREGNYDPIGRLTLTPGNGDPSSYRTIAPGEFTLNAGKYFNDDPLTYTLKVAAGILPTNLASISVTQPYLSWDFNLPPAQSYHYANPYGDYCCQELGQRLTAFSKAGDGSETKFLSYDFTRGSSTSLQPLGTDRQLKSTLDYDIGYSYVAMGEWSWRVVDLNGAAAGDFGDLMFVNGDRTPAAGIPASGTATYDARSLALLSSGGAPGIPFTLTADFGQRTMSTQIAQDYRYNPAGAFADPILGIHVGGSAAFSNDGSFGIPLTGTANYASSNSPTTPAAEPVTGDMNGAFFGPHAEQVGGVFSINRSGGVPLMQDAFVGQQHPH